MKLIIFVVFFNFILAEGNDIIADRHPLRKTRRKHDKTDLTKILTELKKGIDLCNSRYEATQQNTAFAINDASIFDIRVDSLPKQCHPYSVPKNCAAATACIQRSGIYNIALGIYSSEPFLVECDAKTDGGGWILIQRRQDGSENFNRNWSDYKAGFGSVDGEFFIGLEKMHVLTNYNGPQELLVLLKYNNETKKAFYSNFLIGDESESYALKRLGAFFGDADNPLSPHLGAHFSTIDRNNDVSGRDCGQIYTGGWWYKACHKSNLNGNYGDTHIATGVSWETLQDHNASLREVIMMIRRRLS